MPVWEQKAPRTCGSSSRVPIWARVRRREPFSFSRSVSAGIAVLGLGKGLRGLVVTQVVGACVESIAMWCIMRRRYAYSRPRWSVRLFGPFKGSCIVPSGIFWTAVQTWNVCAAGS